MEAIRQPRAERARRIERGALRTIQADPDLQRRLARALRPLRHHVHDTTDRPFAVQHRRRAAQHLDALDRPRIERERDRAGGRHQPHAVEQRHHRFLPAETAHAQCGAAGAGRHRAGETRGARHRVEHRAIAARVDRVGRDRLDARGRVEARGSSREPVSSGCVSGSAGADGALTLIAGSACRSSGAGAAASAANTPEVAIAQPSRSCSRGPRERARRRRSGATRRGAAPRAPGCVWFSSRRIDLRRVASHAAVPGSPSVAQTSDDTIYQFDSSGFRQVVPAGCVAGAVRRAYSGKLNCTHSLSPCGRLRTANSCWYFTTTPDAGPTRHAVAGRSRPIARESRPTRP